MITTNHPKIPQTAYGVHTLITKRWSARSFSSEPLTDSELGRIFEAASWAASSMNEQPWQFHYARKGTAAFERMHACLNTGNQPWAANADVLILSLAQKTFQRNGHSNRHAMYDVGAATANLLLQAAEMDIYGHVMGGFDMDRIIGEFAIDATQFEVAAVIALGKLDEADALEEPFRSREKNPRTRKSLDEFVLNLGA